MPPTSVADLPTATLRNVEILRIGTWTGSVGGTQRYTAKTLDDIVHAYHALRSSFTPFLKLGHDDGQQLLQEDGYPAIGQPSNLRRVDDALVADFENVPAKLASLIKAKGYRDRSCEIWFDQEFEGRKYPAVLKAVALLGADAPAVTGLNDMVAMYSRPNETYLDDGGREVTVVHLATAATKTEDGENFPASDYAYVPDPATPSTWKLRLTKTPSGDPDAGIVGAAAAALGPGFRGQKVDVPAKDRAKVVAKVRAAWSRANPDRKPNEMPAGIKATRKLASPSFDDIRNAVQDALEQAYPWLYDEDGDSPSGVQADGPSQEIECVYMDAVVVWDQDHDELWQMPYTMAADGDVELGPPVKVRAQYMPVGEVSMTRKAELARRPMPDAPDDTPADDEDEDGAASYAAMEQALGSFQQHLDRAMKGKPGVGMMRKLHSMLGASLKSIKGQFPDLDTDGNTDGSEGPEGEQGEELQGGAPKRLSHQEGESMLDTEIRELLGLADDADLKQTLIGLKAGTVQLSAHEDVLAKLRVFEEKDNEREATALVDRAVKEHKLSARKEQRDWAMDLASRDRPAFEAYLASAPSIWESGEVGSAGEAPASVIPESTFAIAKKMGISEEAFRDQRPMQERLALLRAEKEKSRDAARGLRAVGT